MSTTTTRTATAAAADVPTRRRTAAAAVLTGVAALSAVFALSVNAPVEDPFEHDARMLITSFGVGMCLLAAVVALGPFRRGERWAWAALWVWPAFFVMHVATLGTWVPDGPLALITAGALLVSRPRGAA